MANKNFPCKGCTNRAVGCHSYCEDYNRAKADYEEEKENEKIQADIDKFLVQSALKRVDYYKRKYLYKNGHVQRDYVD